MEHAMETLKASVLPLLLAAQQHELNEYELFRRMAKKEKDPGNRKVLHTFANSEHSHYEKIKSFTGHDLKPQLFLIWVWNFLSTLLGITFTVKFLEKIENRNVAKLYALADLHHYDLQTSPIGDLLEEEESAESILIKDIDEERLEYMGSIVLGMNDALVELTGALAGFTFAFQNNQLIAVTGLITGLSATLSMAASEYLSTRQEGGKDAIKSSIYTGLAYVLTVVFLIAPYLVLSNPFVSLGLSLLIGVFIIIAFTFYSSITNDHPFTSRFLEMAGISLGVAGISFFIGFLLKMVIGVDI